MPLSTKKFVLSNSSLNSQGFRMLTNGAILDDFLKNPVMLFNHIRPEGNMKNQILPIGHWENIELNGDEITAVPFFDDKDEFAMAIYHKVEAGHIRMCSIGAEPVETSKKRSDLLPGQKLATVTRWKAKEASICDIGANPDALSVALYDSNDRMISLAETNIETLIPTITTMAKKTTTAGEAGKKHAAAKKPGVKLADDPAKKDDAELSDDEEKDEELSDDEETEELSDEDKDAKIADLEEKLKQMSARCAELEEKLKLSEEEAEDDKAAKLADKAIQMRKITLAQKDHIINLAKKDYNGTVKYLNSIKSAPSIKSQLEGGSTTTLDKDAEKIKKLSEKSYDELFSTPGALNLLKDKSPEVYKLKFKEKFGKEPKNV